METKPEVELRHGSKQMLEQWPKDLDECRRYYAHQFFCANCGAAFYRYILKGVKVKELAIVKCPECECEL